MGDKCLQEMQNSGEGFSGQNQTLIEFLNHMATNKIVFEKVDVMASGSRRFDMIMIGTINDKFFSQYFMLNHEKDNIWYIKSSIISISQK